MFDFVARHCNYQIFIDLGLIVYLPEGMIDLSLPQRSHHHDHRLAQEELRPQDPLVGSSVNCLNQLLQAVRSSCR